jgi:hypothetical protein
MTTKQVVLPEGVTFPCASYAPQVATDKSQRFAGNALRFPSYEEARANVEELASRWMLVVETRVVGSNDAPTHRWIEGKLSAIQPSLFTEEVSA